MNLLQNYLRASIILVVLFSLISCEDDFNTIGNDIIGTPDFNTDPYVSEVIAYNKKIEAVQTNGLPLYLFGNYTDPFYGTSQASILAQLSMSTANPEFGANPVLDSVVLVLPYYSTIKEQTAEKTTYTLDSIYGSGGMKVSVYESNYFLRDLDPDSNFQDPQLYYSNQATEFENNLGTLLTVKSIVPSAEGVSVYQYQGEQKDTLQLSPRIRISLPIDFFKDKIIDKQGSQELLSNSNFKNYFRGLYLKAETVGNGSMAALNFSQDQSKVILYYTSEVPDVGSDSGGTVESHTSYVLNIQGNIVNVFSDNFPVDLSNQNTVEGEPNLYLKGGRGSMAIIKLFDGPDSDGDGVSDELETLREENWLINEANLTFVVNDALAPNEEKEPQRIFIYNMKDNSILLDYQIDFTASDSDPENSRILHLVPLTTDENGDRFYKIRVTGLIRNIINLDSTNVELGVTIASNVNLNSLAKLKDAEDEIPSAIPVTSIISPKGTVLYGNTAPIENKRLKLNIFYTKPE